MKTFLLSGSLLLALVFLTGCKKSADESLADNCTRAGQKAEAYTAALQAYSASPTKANCEKVKSTALDYVEIAASCSTIGQADLKAARDQINALVCQ